ncbi:4a-hydroxytetrahydrobiopterin dehydratase [Saccharobesus litoralis]|uniref:Putative pterin-4-alpha-carbinolamine dehydratase n=1 Tax=Saccharobesus litoralis TaxID=2172099 RepID=A0A2S0VXQ4_9ALTE|nr:4a-hydroxytetrahydrobiopterin dehydratase [Saccharobesus litoralis]
MQELCKSQCEPCRVGAPVLPKAEQLQLLEGLDGWQVIEVDGIEQVTKFFDFKNYIQAMEFTNHIAELAEKHGHHPAILTEWGKVTVTWWTHKIKGLHKNDFIMAAHTQEIYHQRIEEALANI